MKPLLIIIFLLTLTLFSESLPQQRSIKSLSDMSIEDLMNIKVSTLAKRPQSFIKSPAAIYVLTSDDIKRIEIIRGPGGSLWGTNAVNGIINVITKNTKDTQNWLIPVRGGSNNDKSYLFRYGTQISILYQ